MRRHKGNSVSGNAVGGFGGLSGELWEINAQCGSVSRCQRASASLAPQVEVYPRHDLAGDFVWFEVGGVDDVAVPGNGGYLV